MIDDEEALRDLLDRVAAPPEVRREILKAARIGRHTKRQHYVPAGYLEAWADERGQVGVWDTQEGRLFPAAPANVCAQSDFYTTRLEDGTRTRLMEGFLATLDDRFISRVRKVVADRQLPQDREERIWLAFDIALNENRLPQRRRLMSAMADRVSRTTAGHELVKRGLAPNDFEVVVTEEEHVRQMLDGAMNVAPFLAACDWTLYVSEQPVIGTCDVPVLFDYTERPGAEQLSKSPAGRYSLASAHAAGMSSDRLNVGIATTTEILVPLAPTALLHIDPYGSHERADTAALPPSVRNRHERLLVRCRERMIVAQPGHQLVSGQRPVVRRRKQLLLECISTAETETGGECVQRFSSAYAAEPLSLIHI